MLLNRDGNDIRSSLAKQRVLAESTDETLRTLERQAAAGDTRAMARLAMKRTQTGVSGDDPFLIGFRLSRAGIPSDEIGNVRGRLPDEHRSRFDIGRHTAGQLLSGDRFEAARGLVRAGHRGLIRGLYNSSFEDIRDLVNAGRTYPGYAARYGYPKELLEHLHISLPKLTQDQLKELFPHEKAYHSFYALTHPPDIAEQPTGRWALHISPSGGHRRVEQHLGKGGFGHHHEELPAQIVREFHPSGQTKSLTQQFHWHDTLHRDPDKGPARVVERFDEHGRRTGSFEDYYNHGRLSAAPDAP